MKKYLKNCSIGILVILSYFLIPTYIKYIVAYLSNGSLSEEVSVILSIIIEVLTFAVILLLFNKRIKENYIDLKKNHKKYFSKYFKFYLIGLAIMYISNAILIFGLNGGLAGNEESIRSILLVHPIYVYISAVLIAPSVEELVFRGAIKNIIPNNILYILFSGLIFGGMHLVGNVTSIIDLLYIIPYSSLGIAFAYIYSKTDNIFVTMLLHTMHNGILISIQIAVMLFG